MNLFFCPIGPHAHAWVHAVHLGIVVGAPATLCAVLARARRRAIAVAPEIDERARARLLSSVGMSAITRSSRA